jgi:4-cresol dehydrogenase (hydroxylating)
MFCQSNFGIVSSMGLWLMPQPESTVFFRCNTPQSEDLEAAVTAILNLKRGGVLDSYNSMVSWLGIVACFSQRKDFYDGPGALPEATIQEILKKFDIGWWNFDLALSGPEDLLVAKKRIVEQEMMRAGGRIRFASSIWRRGDAKTNPGEPAPDMTPMQFINWYGGAGGHIDFSPVIPARPADAVSYFRQSYAMFQEAGLDFFAAYHFGSRHLICPTNLIYDRSNTAMTTRVTSMFSALLENASRQGLSEYRTHLSYMDAVAGTFEFNNHALLRLNEKIKDAIDPNGILAPGKSGIWPKAYRRHKT